MRRAITLLLACGLLLAIGPVGAAVAAPRSVDYFLPYTAGEHDILILVAVGPPVEAKRAFRVKRKIERSDYRAAWSSVRGRGSRKREANAFAVQVARPEPFEPFGSIPVSRVVSEQDIWATKVWILRVPASGDADVRPTVSGVRMPRIARRAVRSLIDTSTGEVVWADE